MCIEVVMKEIMQFTCNLYGITNKWKNVSLKNVCRPKINVQYNAKGTENPVLIRKDITHTVF